MPNEMTTEEKISILRNALFLAKEHLEYCGYGDSWERECAKVEKLEEGIEYALSLEF